MNLKNQALEDEIVEKSLSNQEFVREKIDFKVKMDNDKKQLNDSI